MTQKQDCHHASKFKQFIKGDRRALAQAITLIESDRKEDRSKKDALLQKCFSDSSQSLRVGISGTPGVGKSTFIEAFGLYAIEQGHRVAVLAIDPSSPLSHGAILGDKTRMSLLASNENAFIRPSPSGSIAGGVNKYTHETILLCEAAGFDLILIETVGVGQEEADVVDHVDLTILLMSPTGGDAIQGMKKGLLELVNLILVNKADGTLKPLAFQMAKELKQTLSMSVNRSSQKVMTISALEKTGMDQVYAAVLDKETELKKTNQLKTHRQQQNIRHFWAKIDQYLLEDCKEDERLKSLLAIGEKKMRDGLQTPSQAAQEIINAFLKRVT